MSINTLAPEELSPSKSGTYIIIEAEILAQFNWYPTKNMMYDFGSFLKVMKNQSLN